jgi:hypothetical protein
VTFKANRRKIGLRQINDSEKVLSPSCQLNYMKMKIRSVAFFLISMLISPIILNFSFPVQAQTENQAPDVFVGVDVAYENLTEIKTMVDEISSYTNLFVIGCTGITYNVTKLDETCQYLYDKGLFFIVYTEKAFQRQWFEDAKKRWGERFLGFYLWDESGGKQLDLYEYKAVVEADNYTDASNRFVNAVKIGLNRLNYIEPATSLFTSDYALYWFDYRTGYDVVFAEFGWNYSRELNVALCRGAATVQNREWGVMIPWTYTQPPYLESGSQLYDDMVLAYDSGAKYILVFDSDENYTQGTLKQEHFDALKRFWQYAAANPRVSSVASDRVAYVLPEGYAYGFRGPNDKIWGLWEADNLTDQICNTLGGLMKEYGTKLDVIYDEGLQPNNTYAYSKLLFWNASLPPSPTPPSTPLLDSPTTFLYTIAVASAAFVGTWLIVYFVRKKDKTSQGPL